VPPLYLIRHSSDEDLTSLMRSVRVDDVMHVDDDELDVANLCVDFRSAFWGLSNESVQELEEIEQKSTI
jgi:hypothetical protein